jgi:hypothetical protein
MEFTGFTRRFCFERQEWENPRAADAGAGWHLFDAHPVRWFAVVGDTVPIDPAADAAGSSAGPGMTAMRGTRPGLRWRGPAVIAVLAVSTVLAGCGTGALSSTSTAATTAAGPPVSGDASPSRTPPPAAAHRPPR